VFLLSYTSLFCPRTILFPAPPAPCHSLSPSSIPVPLLSRTFRHGCHCNPQRLNRIINPPRHIHHHHVQYASAATELTTASPSRCSYHGSIGPDSAHFSEHYNSSNNNNKIPMTPSKRHSHQDCECHCTASSPDTASTAAAAITSALSATVTSTCPTFELFQYPSQQSSCNTVLNRILLHSGHSRSPSVATRVVRHQQDPFCHSDAFDPRTISPSMFALDYSPYQSSVGVGSK